LPLLRERRIDVFRLRFLATVLCVLVASALPASAARPIVDLHKLDAYFALFASDSNVPWQPTTVRLDTYSSAPVDFNVYQVDPGDVLTAGSNARPRAIDTRSRTPVSHFTFTPPGGYQFQSSQIDVQLGSREGFFVVEARRGTVGEQVWINRTRVGLVTKETPHELLVYGTDLGSGRALAKMRVQFLVGSDFVTRETDVHGIVRWNRTPRPAFALAQWGGSYAFTSLLPQAPLANAIVGVRTDSAVVHAGESVRVVGFARSRSGDSLRPASGSVALSLRLGGTLVAQQQVELDGAGAFTATLAVPADAASGDYALLAQADGGIGGATVHVDANAGGLTLDLSTTCDGPCAPGTDVPVTVRSSRGGVPVHIVIVRSPHIYVGYSPDTTPWATSQWLDATVTTGSDGRATLIVPAPTDGLASTYGVRASAGGATADTRIIVPTARAAVRLHVDSETQTLGTPVNFDVYVNDVAGGAALGGQTVTVQLQHGQSVQQQTLTTDAGGHARGTFTSPSLGMNLILANVSIDGAQATDAGQVDVVPQATDTGSAASSDLRIGVDHAVYHAGEDVRVDASLGGATGDALVTLESAAGVGAAVVGTSGGHARTALRVADAPGDLRVGAAFVRAGAIEWTSVPLDLDAPGRPRDVSLDVKSSSGAATLTLDDALASPGTVVVRFSRGVPTGSAAFESAPSLLAIGLAATQVTAPAGKTWHPWVDSTGDHAQVLGFERRSAPPQDLSIAQAETQAVQWQVLQDDGKPYVVTLPAERGRYTVSVLKIANDGRVLAAQANVVIP
jgi:hypothetical protein